MPQAYIPPTFNATAFHCPHCEVYSAQSWVTLPTKSPTHGLMWDSNSGTACCLHCEGISLWYDGRMIYPPGGAAPPPNPDLTDEIKRDYEEARTIVSLSPRGAAALLRLCVQKLCKELGEPGENINTDIQSLVKRGVLVPVQQALDILRVVGNNAVHPGSLDMLDNHKTALSLFALVNDIVEKEISGPKQTAKLYATLPQETLKWIKQRDGKG